MDWSNERYVRLYTRDTPEWLCMEWQGRACWPLIVRKVDRSGVLATRLGVKGVSVAIGLPVEVVTAGLAALLEDGCLQEHQLGYVIPNFIEAQETPQGDAKRQRESRERRRTVTKRDSSSQNVTDSHDESRDVTAGHDESHDVTPIRSEPNQTEPIQTDPSGILARAIPPGTVHGTEQEPLTHDSKEHKRIRRKLVTDSWQLAGVEFLRLKALGIDETAPNSWSGLPAATSSPMVDLRRIIDELLIGDDPDYTTAEATIRRRILVAGKRAEVRRELQYMTPARMWKPESFWIDSALSPEQVSRGSPTRSGPPKSAKSGRIDPRHHSEYPVGEIPPDIAFGDPE